MNARVDIATAKAASGSDFISGVIESIRAVGVPDDVAAAIGQIIRGNADPGKLRSRDADVRLASVAPLDVPGLARFFHRRFLAQAEMLGFEMLGDPTWHMLLALTAAEGEQRPLSISGLCLSSGAPATTALRHLGELERRGLIRRTPDPRDSRRVFVQLTAQARSLMREAVLSMCLPGGTRTSIADER